MNLKRPELKMPNLKVPPALADVFYDLRDRGLLPLVALVIVAIVAVPFLLANSGSHKPSPAVPPTASAVGGAAAHASRFTVTEVDPGLRVPGKRLAKRRPKDPFVQKFTGSANPEAAGVEEAAGGASQTPVTTTATVTTGTPSTTAGVSVPVESSPPTTPSPPQPTGGGGGENSGGGRSGQGLVEYTWAIDVKITEAEIMADGLTQQGEPETRERVLPPATLPGKKTQVVTFIGLNPKTKKPLFLISTEVSAVFGEGKCVSGTDSCQLLEMEPGYPETFVYGEQNVRYKINVLSVRPVVVGHS